MECIQHHLQTKFAGMYLSKKPGVDIPTHICREPRAPRWYFLATYYQTLKYLSICTWVHIPTFASDICQLTKRTYVVCPKRVAVLVRICILSMLCLEG